MYHISGGAAAYARSTVVSGWSHGDDVRLMPIAVPARHYCRGIMSVSNCACAVESVECRNVHDVACPLLIGVPRPVSHVISTVPA